MKKLWVSWVLIEKVISVKLPPSGEQGRITKQFNEILFFQWQIHKKTLFGKSEIDPWWRKQSISWKGEYGKMVGSMWQGISLSSRDKTKLARLYNKLFTTLAIPLIRRLLSLPIFVRLVLGEDRERKLIATTTATKLHTAYCTSWAIHTVNLLLLH